MKFVCSASKFLSILFAFKEKVLFSKSLMFSFILTFLTRSSVVEGIMNSVEQSLRSNKPVPSNKKNLDFILKEVPVYILKGFSEFANGFIITYSLTQSLEFLADFSLTLKKKQLLPPDIKKFPTMKLMGSLTEFLFFTIPKQVTNWNTDHSKIIKS